MPALKKATDTSSADSGTTVVGVLEAPRDELKHALKRLAAVADRKSAIPILANVCIRVNGASTTLATTDLNVSLTIKAPWIGDCFCVSVSVKTLADIVAKMPGGTVRISRQGDEVVTVSSGPASMRLDAISDREFPTLPQTEQLRWSRVAAGPLAEMFDLAIPFVCEDQTRFHLNGVLFESDGSTVRTVSTDGHRLMKRQRSLHGCPAYPKGVIVPLKGCQQIVKLLAKARGDCEMAVTQRFFFVRHDGATLAIKLIDAEFPAYEQVIPKDNPHIFSVNRAEFAAALGRAKLFCNDKHGVKLTVGRGYLEILTDGTRESVQAFGEAAEVDGERAIGFNPNYLIDFMDVICDESVSFALAADELAPAVIQATEHACSYDVAGSPAVHVLMPMRI